MVASIRSLAALACLSLVVACHGSSRADVDAGQVCARCGACEESVTVSGGQHVTGMVAYPDQPPAGGPHNACWASWGPHEIELPPERWVHNLEHGGIVFLYRCDDGCLDDVKSLEALVSDSPRSLLTPYASLPTRFAVVAWGHRLTSDCVDSDAFAMFYAAHVARAPESIAADPPASCPPEGL